MRYMSVCLMIRLSWLYYTEFDTIVRPRARCTLPRIRDETRKIHRMVWGDVIVTSHFEGRSMCVPWNDRSIRIRWVFIQIHYTYIHRIVVYHTTRHPEHGGLSFFWRGQRHTANGKHPYRIYILDLYMLHYEHAVRIEDVRKSILRV